MNFVFGFRVADRHDGSAKKAGGIETLLAVVIANIFHREGRPVEYLLGVREIKAVFFRLVVRLAAFHVKFMGLIIHTIIYIERG